MLIEINLDTLHKAQEESAPTGRKGLVKKKVTVKRGGKTFQQYRWVKSGVEEPAEKKSVEEPALKPKKELAVVGLNKPELKPGSKIEISLDELKEQNMVGAESFDDEKGDRLKVISDKNLKIGDEVMRAGKSYIIEGITGSGLINLGSGIAEEYSGLFESGGKIFAFPTSVNLAEKVRAEQAELRAKWAKKEAEAAKKPKIKIPKKTVDTEKARVDMMGYVAKVDDDELDAMARYTDVDDHKGNYAELNWYIRTGEVEPDNKANVETLIDQVSAFLKNAPKIKGKVYRGMSWSKGGESSKKFDGFLEQMEKGKEVQMNTFTSTSAEPSIVEDLFVGSEGFDHTIRFEIKSKSGVFLGDLSEEAEEQEVLFDKDTKFKVKKVDKSGYPDSVKIVMEEV